MSSVTPGPEVEVHHHHQTGHRWLDITLSVSAICISLMTAVLAFQHGRAMEAMVQQNARMVEASTWPYVGLSTSNSDSDGHALFRIELANNGVGPAKIERVEFRYKGRVVGGMLALADAVAAGAGIGEAAHVMRSDANGVLPARQTVALLNVQAPYSSPALVAAFRGAPAGTFDVGVCYCSIFDDCWTTALSSAGPPVAVKGCGAG